MPEWPHREPRAGRTFDRRDCSHCAHYTSGGNAGGTPPWTVCQFWPRKDPATCGASYSYKHRSFLNEEGEHWSWAKAPTPANQPERDKL